LLSGLRSAISNPAIDTFIPEATPRPASDNALIAATVHNVAKLSGNAATLLLPFLSAVGGFLANGLLMGLSVLLLRSHTPPETAPRPAEAWPTPRRMARHFRAHPESLDIFLGSIMLGLFVVPSGYIFQPLIMRQHFPDQSGLFGLTGIVSWCGAILAFSLAVRFAARTCHPGRWAMLIWAIAALVLVGSVLVPDFWFYLMILFLLGGNSVGRALIYGRYLGDAPRAERGVLIALDQTAYWGLATLGTAILGWFAGRVGLLPTVLTLAGAILLSVLILLLRGRLWRLRRMG
jgi:hypothetical protein